MEKSFWKDGAVAFEMEDPSRGLRTNAQEVLEWRIRHNGFLRAHKLDAAAVKGNCITRNQFPVMLLTTERQNHHSERYLSTTEARLRWLAGITRFVTG
jgi:hypothetical protein